LTWLPRNGICPIGHQSPAALNRAADDILDAVDAGYEACATPST